MNKGTFLNSIIAIIVVLAIVFLSQKPYFEGTGKNLYYKTSEQMEGYWNKASNWLKINIYPRLERGVTEKGEYLKEEIKKEKDNFSQNLWVKIKNYLAGKFSNIFGTKVE